jgi:uncharacterized membrane protein
VGYTPGPWVARISLNGRVSFIQGAPEPGNRYGEAITNSSGFAKPTTERARANARLIAAAPELYEALDAICAEAERMTFTMRRRKIFNAGIAALRKARGEA